jgi:hypothetical protein
MRVPVYGPADAAARIGRANDDPDAFIAAVEGAGPRGD